MKASINVSIPRAIAETLVSSMIAKLEVENIKLIDYSIKFDESMDYRYGWQVTGKTSGEFDIATSIDCIKAEWPDGIRPELVCGYFLVQMHDYITNGNKPICNYHNVNWD